LLEGQSKASSSNNGRKSLVQALENDTAHDGPILPQKDEQQQQQQQTEGEHFQATIISKLLHDLSEDDANHRLKLFGRLFAKQIEDTATVEEQAFSLEQRLAQLSGRFPRDLRNANAKQQSTNTATNMITNNQPIGGIYCSSSKRL